MTTYTNKTTSTSTSIVRASNSKQQPALGEVRQTLPGSNLTYIRGGNILTTKCQTVIVGVNAQGQMHFGMAGQIAKLYPEIVAGYQGAVQHDKFTEGSARRSLTKSGKQVVLVGVWKMQEFAPKFEWLRDAFIRITDAVTAEKLEITSLATAKLGCSAKSQYGLDWEEVGPMMAAMLNSLAIPVEIYVGRNDSAFFPQYNESGEMMITQILPNEFEAIAAENDSSNL